MTWIAVGIGGAIGSAARHGVNLVMRSQSFPWGTILVNVSGSFVIGLLAGLIASRRLAMSTVAREFVFVGLLGGFTTFSTFGLDTFMLARTQSQGYALLNVGLQIGGGLIAVWLGYRLGSASL